MKLLRRFWREYRFLRSTWVDVHGIRWVKEIQPTYEDQLLSMFRLRKVRPRAGEYLTAYPDEFPWGRLWLRYGHAFLPPSRSDSLYLLHKGLLLKEGQCAENALKICMELLNDSEADDEFDPCKLFYAEGLAVSWTGVYPHAWVVYDGRVCDPTWPLANYSTYFGVTFDPEWVRRYGKRTGFIGFTMNWELHGPEIEDALNGTKEGVLT